VFFFPLRNGFSAEPPPHPLEMLSIIIYYTGGTRGYRTWAYIASTFLHRPGSDWWRPRMRDDQSYIGQLYRISARLTLRVYYMTYAHRILCLRTPRVEFDSIGVYIGTTVVR